MRHANVRKKVRSSILNAARKILKSRKKSEVEKAHARMIIQKNRKKK